MSKFFGKIGYSITEETTPGVWMENIIEREYYGDVNRVYRKRNASDSVNDDLDISNEISIIADPYAFENFVYISYVEWMNHKWKVPNIEVQYPRLILSLGGVYNGEQS